jgi:carboxymethylenebutenolidase
MGQTITINATSGSGSFDGYLAIPASGTGPGIVVIQEVFGVNAGIREMCDQWAADGFVALAPDLFWRQEAGLALDPGLEPELMKAFALYQAFDVDAGVADIQATITTLRALPACTGEVGTVGFCLGGLLAYLSATRTDAQASVGYYGVGIEGKLNEADRIKAPLILHIAGADQFVPAPAQAQIHAALDSAPHVTLYDYAGQEHAFSRINGEHYDEASALLARERTLGLFNSTLSKSTRG